MGEEGDGWGRGVGLHYTTSILSLRVTDGRIRANLNVPNYSYRDSDEMQQKQSLVQLVLFYGRCKLRWYNVFIT